LGNEDIYVLGDLPRVPEGISCEGSSICDFEEWIQYSHIQSMFLRGQGGLAINGVHMADAHPIRLTELRYLTKKYSDLTHEWMNVVPDTVIVPIYDDTSLFGGLFEGTSELFDFPTHFAIEGPHTYAIGCGDTGASSSSDLTTMTGRLFSNRGSAFKECSIKRPSLCFIFTAKPIPLGVTYDSCLRNYGSTRAEVKLHLKQQPF
jgi:hypothetical protein